MPHWGWGGDSNMNSEANITTHFLCTNIVIYTDNGNIQFKCTGSTCGREDTAPWLTVLLQFRNHNIIFSFLFKVNIIKSKKMDISDKLMPTVTHANTKLLGPPPKPLVIVILSIQ